MYKISDDPFFTSNWEKPANQVFLKLIRKFESVVLLKRIGSSLDELRFLNSQELSTRVELFGELINTKQT